MHVSTGHFENGLWPAGLSTSAPASSKARLKIFGALVWLAKGSDPTSFGTHAMRRTKVAQVDRKTGTLRAIQLPLGHAKMDKAVRYLGVELEDFLAISDSVET
ncbi:hypothetical protein [Roseovarius sp. D22-M7]|uniref:hypothetical protein n=1 Tax=Roseovarius sp. D22-M7 TaxID=3127116 RepID=UPI0030105626